MSHNSLAFGLFVSAVLFAYSFLSRSSHSKLRVLALASAGFSFALSSHLMAVILLQIFVSHWITCRMATQVHDQKRVRLLFTAVCINLAALACFKYIPGGPEVISRAFADLLPWKISANSVLKPVGISFITFQILSFAFDVYRRRLSGPGSLLEYFTSITFFPRLIAGPLVQSADILRQLRSLAPLSSLDLGRIATLLIVGFFKMNAGSTLGQISQKYLASAASAQSALESWLGIAAYSGHLYADFSGYTDIAMGTALLFGVKLPDNFKLPFLATSPADYWKRWHISLGTWIHDYVYVPLAVRLSRQFEAGTSVAVIVAMVTFGFWHGPKVTYVVFGLYHGLLIVLTSLLAGHFPSWARSKSVFVRAVKILVTTYFVLVGMAIFQAKSWPQAKGLLLLMHSFDLGSPNKLSLISIGVLIALISLSYALSFLTVESTTRLKSSHLAGILGAVLALSLAASGHVMPFIYMGF